MKWLILYFCVVLLSVSSFANQQEGASSLPVPPASSGHPKDAPIQGLDKIRPQNSNASDSISDRPPISSDKFEEVLRGKHDPSPRLLVPAQEPLIEELSHSSDPEKILEEELGVDNSQSYTVSEQEELDVGAFEKALQAEMDAIPGHPMGFNPSPDLPVPEIEQGEHSLSVKTNSGGGFVDHQNHEMSLSTMADLPVDESHDSIDMASIREGDQVDLASLAKDPVETNSEIAAFMESEKDSDYKLPPIFMEEALSSNEIAALYEVSDAEFIMTWASFSTTLRKFLGLCEYMETSIRRGASRQELYQNLAEMRKYWDILDALTWPPDEYHQRGHYSHIVKSWDLYLWCKALTETFTEPPYHRNLYYYNMALEVGHHTADWNSALAYLMQSRFMSDPEVFRLCAIHLLKDAQENMQVYMKPGHKLPRRVLMKRNNKS